MPFIPAQPGVAKVNVHWIQGAAHGQNVHWFKTAAGASLDVTTLDQIIDQFAHGYNVGSGTGILGGLSVDTTIVLMEAVSMETDSSPGTSQTFTLSGHVSGVSTPPGMAAVVTWLTGLRGRSQRGRSYFMGWPNANVGDDGIIAATPFTAWETQVEATLEAINDAAVVDGNMVVASSFHGVDPVTHQPIPRDEIVTHPITGFVCRRNLHSQRRRNLAA